LKTGPTIRFREMLRDAARISSFERTKIRESREEGCMNDRGSCPDRALLESFALDRLPPEQSRAAEDHLLHCDTCLSNLEAACGLESVLQALRRPPSREDAREEPVLSELIERGRRLHAQTPTTPPDRPATAGSVATPREGPGGTDVTPTTAATTAGEELQVLAPPQGPGEIGRLGPYRVLELLGQGGMGTVYLAEDPHLGRRVALKTLQPALAAERKARERFLREARAAAALEHDHIVPIYQVGEERGVPFLAMPLLRGESLETRLHSEKKVAPAEAVRIAREAAEGLACAHAAGLIHRDVKPANLWLEPSPRRRVKVLDFGLARPAESGQGLTEAGALVGTPGYIAPEQGGGGPLDGRADLFSLGVVLYRMLTGRMPFRCENMVKYIESLVSRPPSPPATVEPAVPEALSDLVLRLLARNPADRPASAAALVAELAEVPQTGSPSPPPLGETVGGEAVLPPLSPRGRGVGGEGAGVPPGAETATQERPRTQRPAKRPGWVIAAGVAAVVLLGLAAIAPYLPTRQRPSPDTWPETPTLATPAPPARVRVERIDAEHFTGDTGDSCGLLGIESFVTHFNDSVKVAARLSRPAPAYLIAFRPDGEEELVFPDEGAPPPEEERPRYPWHPGDRAKRFGLDDGAGLEPAPPPERGVLEVFAVVVLRRPLPYRDWKVQRGPGPWKRQFTPRDVVWWDNGAEVERQTADDRRKGKDVPGASQVAALTDWLKKAPEVEAVAALGFAVVGKERR
jgi:hypothetical protein